MLKFSLSTAIFSLLFLNQAYAIHCDDALLNSANEAISLSTVKKSQASVILRKIGRTLSVEPDGRLKVDNQYLSEFSPVTSLRAYQLSSGKTYLLVWKKDPSIGVTNFDIIEFGQEYLRRIEIHKAPEDLLEAAKKEYYQPPLGRVTIVNIQKIYNGYVMSYQGPYHWVQAGWLNADQLKKLMEVSGAQTPEALIGYSRIIVAPEMRGFDILVDRLSGATSVMHSYW